MKKEIFPENIEEAIEWLNPDVKISAPCRRGAWVCVRNLYSKKVKDKRAECHQWFDKLWTSHAGRNQLYAKLADELGIDREECHFSRMCEKDLDKSLHILKMWWKKKYDR